jgi:hypothetical protein
MLPIDEAISEKLRSGSCCCDDAVTQLPDFTWEEIFVAVGCMSRDGRLLLCDSVTRTIRSHSTRSLYISVQQRGRRGCNQV